MSDPILSVCVITYNHAKYFRQALESVLMQRVNFSWEIIVADDYSKDGTRKIALEYAEKHPELFRLIFQEKNVGPAINFFDLLKSARGKYIAYLEGDDYWASEEKLNEQVKILESNVQYAMCVHNTKMIYEDNSSKVEYFRPDWSDSKLNVLTIEDQIKLSLPYHSSSVVFRNIIHPYPEFLYNAISGDITLFTVLAEKGDILFLDKVWSVRRGHSKGVSVLNAANVETNYERRVNMYKDINGYFNFKYDHLYKPYIYRNLGALILTRNRSGQFVRAYRSLAELYSVSDSLTQFISFFWKNIKITARGILQMDSKII